MLVMMTVLYKHITKVNELLMIPPDIHVTQMITPHSHIMTTVYNTELFENITASNINQYNNKATASSRHQNSATIERL